MQESVQINNSLLPAKKYIHTAIQIPIRCFFTYIMPDQPVYKGQRLCVPFQNKNRIGLAIDSSDTSHLLESSIKKIIEVLPDGIIPDELINLLTWAADYYHYPVGEALFTALPTEFRKVSTRKPKNSSSTVADSTRIENNRVNPASTQATKLVLNDQQKAVVDEVISWSGGFKCWILDGLTGSGKTEVYLRAVAHHLQAGKQALVLVPEIGLTPQVLKRFKSFFGDTVAVIHSALTPVKRRKAWQKCASNEAQILLGTRSALFTPLPNLGFIVIDEEQDTSYKQQDELRYSARDLAIKYAHNLNIPIILSSATPSFETLANIELRNFKPLKLSKRAGNAQMPEWKILDTRKQKNDSGLAIETLEEISKGLARNEQILVFINRRGFAPVMICSQCNWIADCPNCDVHMTVHKNSKLTSTLENSNLLCHHCLQQQQIPDCCPTCNGFDLLPLGMGTQRVENLLTTHFPDIEILRIDRDNLPNRQQLLKTLKSLAKGAKRILVGTQMLAKGHDINNLSLAVMANIDAGLFNADFRSPEHTAQLMVQVAGRAGRSKSTPGMVLIQTRYPDHPLIQTVVHKGYHYFASRALEERREAGLPPYTKMALIQSRGTDLQLCEQLLADLAQQNHSADVQCWGPIPAPIKRKANEYRFQLILNARNSKALHLVLQTIIAKLDNDKRARKVHWYVDVDPIDLS